MRKLFAFLVRLFSFWTWKDLFLRWLRSPASHPANGTHVEHLPSQEGQRESEFVRMFSSLPEHERRFKRLIFDGDSKVKMSYRGYYDENFRVEVDHCEFLEAVASSKIVFRERVQIGLWGHGSCKHVEPFIDALRQSGNGFRELSLACKNGSAVQFAKCVSIVLLGTEAIQPLQHLDLAFDDLEEELDKELAAEFMAIIAGPHILRILKDFCMRTSKLDGEGMEQLMKPFRGPPNVLKSLSFPSLTSNAQLEHISSLLASSTSLKTLRILKNSTPVENSFKRGYNNIATALCSNQSLKLLWCSISSSMELKVLLDPLIPQNNNLQRNTTLTNLRLYNSIGGKEGIENLVDLIHTNTSLLQLGLFEVDDLSLNDTQGIENVLAVLEALKTNKSLKKVQFSGCKAVCGYKVLGAMMDLLLENHNIQDIDLTGTGSEESGDADYVSSALLKRKKMYEPTI